MQGKHLKNLWTPSKKILKHYFCLYFMQQNKKMQKKEAFLHQDWDTRCSGWTKITLIKVCVSPRDSPRPSRWLEECWWWALITPVVPVESCLITAPLLITCLAMSCPYLSLINQNQNKGRETTFPHSTHKKWKVKDEWLMDKVPRTLQKQKYFTDLLVCTSL